MQTNDLWLMLRAKYAAPEWAIFREVPASTGGGSRSADAIAMNLWRSRGLKIVGFELKRDRRDWLRELKDPEKAETLASLCDEWWLVTSQGVVKDETEVPGPWGWLCTTKNGKALRVKRKATPLKPLKRKLEPIGRSFVAALIRRAHEAMESAPERRAEYDRGFAEGQKIGADKSDWAQEKRILEQRVRVAEQEVAQYEEAKQAAGLGEYDAWNLPQIAKHVAMLKRCGPNQVVNGYRGILRNLDFLHQNLTAALKQFEDEPEGVDVVGEIDRIMERIEAGDIDDDVITILTNLRASATPALEAP